MQDAAFAVQRRIANASASPADSSVSPAAPAKDLALVSNKAFARLVQKARRVRAAANAANDSNSTRDPVAFDWEAAIGVARESVASSPDVDVCIAARTAIHPPVYYAPPRKSPEPVLHSVSDEDSASATAAASKEAERELAEKLCPSTINARYLNSVHNGHAIGVAGFVAYLPESEVRLPKKIASVARGKKINNVPIYDRARTMLSRELGDNYMRSEGNEIEVQVKSVNWDYGSGTWKIGVTQKFGENDETSSSFYRGLMPSAGSRATRDDPFTSGNILKQLRGRSEPLFGRKAANPFAASREEAQQTMMTADEPRTSRISASDDTGSTATTAAIVRTPSALRLTTPASPLEPFFVSLPVAARDAMFPPPFVLRRNTRPSPSQSSSSSALRKASVAAHASSSESSRAASLARLLRSDNHPRAHTRAASAPLPSHLTLSARAASASAFSPASSTSSVFAFSPQIASRTSSSPRFSKNASLIHTAKTLLAKLERMWGEVSGVPVRTKRRRRSHKGSKRKPKSSDHHAWLSQMLIAQKSRELVLQDTSFSTDESSEIDANFFFEKSHVLGEDDEKVVNQQHSFGISEADAKVIASLKDDKVINNRTLVPIIANLENLVNDEINRRNQVMHSIKDLHDHLFNACERLCVPIEKFINAQTFPPNASIYAKREILVCRVSDVDQVIRSREERLIGFKEAVLDIRKILEDCTEDEYVVVAEDNLSAATIDAWMDVLYALEEEKSRRQNLVANTCAKIYLTAQQLSKFPSESPSEQRLTEFLLTPIPADSENLHDLPLLPSVPHSPAKLLRAKLHSHYSAMLDAFREAAASPPQMRNTETVPPVSLSLTRACIEWLKTILERLESELSSRRDACKALVKEIRLCAADIGSAEDAAVAADLDPDDLGRLDEYRKLADELRARWKLKMQEAVVRLLLDLTAWWDKCFITPEERKEFTGQFGDNLFSPLTVERITLEIHELQIRFEEEHHLYELINSRSALLTKMVEFEASASDPQRLFKSSFRLNEEERFRKTCVPALRGMEDTLREQVSLFEKGGEHQRPFIFRGTNFLSALDKEASERFINNAVFLFDTTGKKNVRPSASADCLSPGKKGPAPLVTKSPRTPSARKDGHSLRIGASAPRRPPSPISPEQLCAIKQMLRVDQAGELAADAIYRGQLAVLPSSSKLKPVIEHMWTQEKHHLEILNNLVANNRVRPSVFSPLWYSLGYALGAGTALMGDNAAMMCTEVVETVIGTHYNE
ncbi:hypothetical protein HDU84_006456 [Entophlyctis sp. JEL0112]|nr:hypothetical protein HDU84_006456 [Entophlyctis sp. JEL0112]